MTTFREVVARWLLRQSQSAKPVQISPQLALYLAITLQAQGVSDAR